MAYWTSSGCGTSKVSRLWLYAYTETYDTTNMYFYRQIVGMLSTYLPPTMKLISLRVRQYVNSMGFEKPVMACFMVLCQKQLRGLRKTTFNVSQNKWCRGRDPNRAPPRYKSWCKPKWSVKNPLKKKICHNLVVNWYDANSSWRRHHSNLSSIYKTSCPLKPFHVPPALKRLKDRVLYSACICVFSTMHTIVPI